MGTRKTYDGLPIELYIDKTKAEHKKWGKLANELVRREYVVAIIEYFEEELERIQTATVDAANNNLQLIEHLKGEVTAANRRTGAATARESKCKKELKQYTEDKDTS